MMNRKTERTKQIEKIATLAKEAFAKGRTLRQAFEDAGCTWDFADREKMEGCHPPGSYCAACPGFDAALKEKRDLRPDEGCGPHWRVALYIPDDPLPHYPRLNRLRGVLGLPRIDETAAGLSGFKVKRNDRKVFSEAFANTVCSMCHDPKRKLRHVHPTRPDEGICSPCATSEERKRKKARTPRG